MQKPLHLEMKQLKFSYMCQDVFLFYRLAIVKSIFHIFPDIPGPCRSPRLIKGFPLRVLPSQTLLWAGCAGAEGDGAQICVTELTYGIVLAGLCAQRGTCCSNTCLRASTLLNSRSFSRFILCLEQRETSATSELRH